MAKCERDPDDQLLSYSIIEVPFKSSSYPLKGEITDICTQHYNMFILYRIIQPIFHKNINKWWVSQWLIFWFHLYVEVFGYLDNSVSQLVLLHVVSTSFLSLVCISKKQPTKKQLLKNCFRLLCKMFFLKTKDIFLW